MVLSEYIYSIMNYVSHHGLGNIICACQGAPLLNQSKNIQRRFSTQTASRIMVLDLPNILPGRIIMSARDCCISRCCNRAFSVSSALCSCRKVVISSDPSKLVKAATSMARRMRRSGILERLERLAEVEAPLKG